MREFACRHRLGEPEAREKMCDFLGGAAAFLSFVYPSADQDVLRLAADTYMWFVSFDDFHIERADDEGIESLTRRIFQLLGVLGGSAAQPPVGFGSALGEILQRAEVWDRSQQDELRNALYGLLLGWQWEAHLRVEGSQPTLQTFLDARLHLGGGLLDRALAEPLGGYVLPAAARQDPQLISLKRAAANLVGWVNDLYSRAKEERQDGSRSVNLSNVLMREHHCSRTDAITRTRELISQEAKAAAGLIQQLSQSPLPEVRAYACDTDRLLSRDVLRAVRAVPGECEGALPLPDRHRGQGCPG
ncbi:hypothetical protein ABT072_48040, partial [Streptomyces sp. NPDC002589]|uniref:terpene synthase family protein n=1 Tax=Streptomyces sp. NPDC002589 TaxID=3154420 RepID=UPI003324A308